MGLGIFGRSCWTNKEVSAPNPNPKAWKLDRSKSYPGACVLEVIYEGCTNFEGRKIMVYDTCFGLLDLEGELDPHFAEKGGPIARFRPDKDGWQRACELAESVTPGLKERDYGEYAKRRSYGETNLSFEMWRPLYRQSHPESTDNYHGKLS